MHPRKSKNRRRYNWRPQLPDHRDIRLAAVSPTPPPQGIVLPSSVDLRPKCPPVVDQGNAGSCTANALAGALGYLELQDLAAGQTGQAVELDASFQPFSRLFIYWNERSMEGDTDQDGGAQIRDGVKSLNQVGCCSEASWPYYVGNLYTEPPVGCVTAAGSHKISAYYALDAGSIDQLKMCLAQGYPFVFGFTVFESFESEAVAQTGLMPVPSLTEECLGGHAVMAVGYDDTKAAFIVRNSWGPGWGDGGYFYMPYSVMENTDLVSDFWTLRK